MKYKELAQEVYKSKKAKIQQSDGTITGMSKKIETVKTEMEALSSELNSLANTYIKENNLSEEKIEEIKGINQSLYDNFPKEVMK